MQGWAQQVPALPTRGQPWLRVGLLGTWLGVSGVPFYKSVGGRGLLEVKVCGQFHGWSDGPRALGPLGTVSKPSEWQSLCWVRAGSSQHRSQILDRPPVGTRSSEPHTAEPGRTARVFGPTEGWGPVSQTSEALKSHLHSGCPQAPHTQSRKLAGAGLPQATRPWGQG